MVVVKAGVDSMGEVIGEDRGYGRDGMVGERETALRGGGRGSVCEGACGTED